VTLWSLYPTSKEIRHLKIYNKIESFFLLVNLKMHVSMTL